MLETYENSSIPEIQGKWMEKPYVDLSGFIVHFSSLHFFLSIKLPVAHPKYPTHITVYDIFINCSWVVTGWQYTFTHKQYIEQHK